MGRKQFTFYDSFFIALKRIRKKQDRADAYDAICEYALYGTEPDLDHLPDSAAIAFSLSKPNLDASRRKAESGKRGGQAKQTGSKPEAKPKQTGSEKESEIKDKREIEKENKSYLPPAPLSGGTAPTAQAAEKQKVKPPSPEDWGFGPELTSAFESWLRYKAEKRQGYKPEGLQALVTETRHNAERYGERAVAALIRKCMSANWQGIIWERMERASRGASSTESGRKSWAELARELEGGSHDT